MKKATVLTKNAPAPIGAYSQAIVAGDFVFTSGQLPILPDTGKIEDPSIEGQTRQVLLNIKAIVAEAGGSMENVIKVTVFLQDLDDFAAMNNVYAEFLSSAARMVFQAVRLPRNARVAMDAVAYLG